MPNTSGYFSGRKCSLLTVLSLVLCSGECCDAVTEADIARLLRPPQHTERAIVCVRPYVSDNMCIGLVTNMNWQRAQGQLR